MGYSKRTYTEARAIIDARRKQANATAQYHTSEIYSQLSEVKEIDIALANTAAELAEAIALGKTGLEDRLEAIKSKNLSLQKKRKQLLIGAGYDPNYTKVKYHCEKCEDTGFTMSGSCECLKRELARITLENSGIGKLVQSQSFENFDFKYYTTDFRDTIIKNFNTIKTFAEKFDENTISNLLLIGSTGLGKTHLSTACAKAVIDRGYEVIYDTAQNILSDFEYERFGKDYNSESTEKKTEKYFTCDLLIIDDLGTEMSNNFTVSTMYNLINSRINAKKPMIISTNLSSSAIMSHYDTRIASRMLGEFMHLPFSGKDIRMQKLT